MEYKKDRIWAYYCEVKIRYNGNGRLATIFENSLRLINEYYTEILHRDGKMYHPKAECLKMCMRMARVQL